MQHVYENGKCVGYIDANGKEHRFAHPLPVVPESML